MSTNTTRFQAASGQWAVARFFQVDEVVFARVVFGDSADDRVTFTAGTFAQAGAKVKTWASKN